MRKRLTKRTIDAARYPAGSEGARGAFYVWDSDVAGFGLRVYPSGRKAFIVTYRVRGKQRFYTVGRYGELTVQQARSKALEVLGRSRQGEDPAAERHAYMRAPTVADLATRYMEEHARPHKKPAGISNDETAWRLHILPALAKRRVADLTQEDIESLRPGLMDQRATFNYVRRVLSCALNLAEGWGWRGKGSNPCRDVRRFKVTNRERYLSRSELARLSEALAEGERTGVYRQEFITAVRLLLLTGCRCGEIRTLCWKDVDFERQCLRLSESKTGSKVVYLSAPAVEVLAGIEREGSNPWVLPGAKPGKPLSDIGGPWRKLRAEVGLDDVRLHDLRHTFASLGVGMGLSLQMVGKLLGHSNASTTEIYAHLADDPVREANERIGAEVGAILSGRPKAEVVAISAQGG